MYLYLKKNFYVEVYVEMDCNKGEFVDYFNAFLKYIFI